MVWTNDSEFTRSSICFARRDRNGYIDRLERILDYRRDINGVGSYQWVYDAKGKPGPKDPDNPKTFYRQETVESLHESGEDFLYVKWKPNPDKPERPTLKDPYTRTYDFVPNCYEVINCPTDNLEGLRARLASGWPYSGNPTRQILMIYAGANGSCDAVLVNRNDLDFSGRNVRLKPNAPLGAERYSILESDVKYLPEPHFGEKHERLMYIKPLLPAPEKVVLIQSLERYALQYMRWYLNKVRFVESGFDRKSFETMLIEAVQSPNYLIEFGVSLTPSDSKKLRKTILHLADGDEQIRSLVNDTLTNDSGFKKQCINICRQELQSELAQERKTMKAKLKADSNAERQEIEGQIRQKRDEVRRLEELVSSRSESYERLQKLVDPLQTQVDDLNRQLDQAKAGLKQINEQAENDLTEFEKLKEEEQRKLEEQRAETLSRLENDVALKLGLNTMVRSLESALTPLLSKATDETLSATTAPTATPAPIVRALSYPAIPVRQGNKSFTDTLADNLQEYGVISINDSSASPRSLAKACERALSATRLIAVDSAFAAPLANALSYAGKGLPAKHAGIPADWHDTSVLDEMLSDKDTNVLVLDGPIDTVNESLLFALSRLELDTTVILPIGAYGNLRLIAGEIWNHVFHLPTEWYVKLPLSPKSLFQSGKNRRSVSMDKQRLISALEVLHKQTTGMSYPSLVLPAAVSALFEETETGASWVAPHLALRAYADFGLDALKAPLLADSEAAKHLLERIERSRHAG